MNRINFEAKTLRLLSTDYEYLQDAIEASDAKIWRSLLEYPGQKGVLRGFNIGIDTDPTKIKIYHTVGYALTSSGILIESFTSTGGIELSDYTDGVKNLVFLRYTLLDGSYDYESGEVLIGERKALDYTDYTLKYNRSIESYTYEVYTESEYAALSEDEQTELICLGSVIAAGYDMPVGEISSEDKEMVRMFLAEHTITVSSFDPTIQIPQTYVDTSQEVDDNYFGTPQDLQDDLNRLRTEIRYIKGTPTWDLFTPSNLSTFDASVNRLHPNGVLTYAEDFGYVITSSGTAITINRGKINIDGYVYSILTSTGVSFNVPGRELYTVGDLINRLDYEEHDVEVPPQTIYLDHANVRNVYLFDKAYVGTGSPYVENVDYTLDTSTGSFTTLAGGGDIVNETVAAFYQWGYWRCDAIDVLPNGDLAYAVGTHAENPVPPLLSSTGAIRLYLIRISPIRDYITDDDIIDVRMYAAPQKVVTSISADDVCNIWNWETLSSDISYYNSRMVITTSSGDVLAEGDGWQRATINDINVLETSAGLELRTLIYTQQGDNLTVQYIPTDEDCEVTLYYESVENSGIFDTVEILSLPKNSYYVQIPLSIPITINANKGFHHVKLVLTTGVLWNFVSLIIGTLERTLTFDSLIQPKLYDSLKYQPIQFFDMDYDSGCTWTDMFGNLVPSFPATGSPTGQFEFLAHDNASPLYFTIRYNSTTSDAGKQVKFNFLVYVDGVYNSSYTEIFSLPSDTSWTTTECRNFIVPTTAFSTHSNIVVKVVRDNTHTPNHGGNINIIDIVVS